MLWIAAVGFRGVQFERDSRAAIGESSDSTRPPSAEPADAVPGESLGEPCGREAYGGVSGEKTKLIEAARADVSTRGANLWVGRFAPKSRLPARNTKNRPVCEQCTAVTLRQGNCRASRASPTYIR